MEEILSSQLMDLVAVQDPRPSEAVLRDRQQSIRVFQGDDASRGRGKYVPIMKKERLEPVEVLNARWVEKKGVKRLLKESSE